MRTRNRRQSNSRDVSNSLHPTLQVALECLDVDLDRELSQYRRSRPRPNGGIRRFLVGLSPKSGRAEALPLPESGTSSGALAAASDGGAEGRLAIAPSTDGTLAPSAENPSDLEDALTQRPAIAQQALPDPKVALENESLESVALTQAGALLKQTQNFANPDGTSPDNLPPPEAYAFPSVREQRQAALQKRRERAWFSGTGIATILMMTAGTVWTYYANYPDSDQYIQMAQVWETIGEATGVDYFGPLQAASREGDGDSGELVARQPVVESSAAPSGPDLANQEFTGLTIARLSLLGASPSPGTESVTTVLGSATSPGAGEDGIPSVTQVPLADDSEDSEAGSSSSADAAAGAGDQSPEVTAIPDDGTRYFYVVEPYKTANPGDEEALLAQAREIVPDAYVRTLAGDRYIQFGALERQEQAESLAKRLLKRGLTIKILHPTPDSETD
ncbi:MAG: hypothetical protein AAGF75_10545 [Cyanobacteria bacterium P01_H01_bin.130]